jgi:thiol-disulfide isomerase/thioredoxin
MRIPRTVMILAVLAVPALGWAAFDLSHLWAAQGNRPPQMSEFTPTDPPRPAPDASFADAAGGQTSLAAFKGKVILVNLWATWCQPCVQEMPALDRLQAALGGKDFAVVLVSQDRGGAHVVEPFFQKLGLSALKSYLDPKGALGQAFQVRGLPTSILIDRAGKELGRVEGAAAWDGSEAQKFLRYQIERDHKEADEPVKAAAR